MRKICKIFTLLLVTLLLICSVSCSSSVNDGNATDEIDYNRSSSNNGVVTLAEINKIITVAKQIYAESDSYTLSDGTMIDMTAKQPKLTLDEVEKMTTVDQTLWDYYKSIELIGELIEDMLLERFPENAVKAYDDPTLNFNYPDYVMFLDIGGTGFSNANKAMVECMKDFAADYDQVGDLLQIRDSKINYYDAEKDEFTCLYPSEEESAIQQVIINLAENGVRSGEVQVK